MGYCTVPSFHPISRPQSLIALFSPFCLEIKNPQVLGGESGHSCTTWCMYVRIHHTVHEHPVSRRGISGFFCKIIFTILEQNSGRAYQVQRIGSYHYGRKRRKAGCVRVRWRIWFLTELNYWAYLGLRYWYSWVSIIRFIFAVQCQPMFTLRRSIFEGL